MFDEVREKLIKFFTSRLTVFTLVFLILAGILVYRCFELQIVQGQKYLDEFILKTEKTRDLSSTRGNIYDRNGNLLAYNELAYSVKIEDVFESGRSKNNKLNETIMKLISMIEKNGDKIITDFKVSGKMADIITATKLRHCFRHLKTLMSKQEISCEW